MHYLVLLLVEFSLALRENSLFDEQVTTAILRIVQLLSKFNLCLVHFLAELLPAIFDLLEFNFELFGLLLRFLLLFRHEILHSLLILDRPFDLDFNVNRAVPNLSVLVPVINLFLVDVCKDLLFLLFVLI